MALAQIPWQYESSSVIDADSVTFLRQIVALVPGIIYVFNHETMSNEYSNRSIAELLGYSPEDIKAMGDDLLPTIIHDDDFDRIAGNVAEMQDLADHEQAVWEYRAIARDGHEVWLRSIETVFTRAADGGVLRHIGIAFDITAEKTAEANLHEVNAALKQQLVDGADSI
ncbi:MULTISPECIES: PAS domain-containing protein [Roseobacter]|nr:MULTISPECIES: PAS domain-containing protein [Roseobacter]GIT85037.1 hypothetical protein ROBYS_00530 [Roseobacter sp. OBYS 0001]